MAKVPNLALNDGNSAPQIGFGVFQIPDAETADAVAHALSAGYRSIDTAAIYGNEAGVRKGIERSGVPRGEIFLTTKLWNAEQGFDETLRAFDASLEKLGHSRRRQGDGPGRRDHPGCRAANDWRSF